MSMLDLQCAICVKPAPRIQGQTAPRSASRPHDGPPCRTGATSLTFCSRSTSVAADRCLSHRGILPKRSRALHPVASLGGVEEAAAAGLIARSRNLCRRNPLWAIPIGKTSIHRQPVRQQRPKAILHSTLDTGHKSDSGWCFAREPSAGDDPRNVFVRRGSSFAPWGEAWPRRKVVWSRFQNHII
jgi:hypothetical protein